MTCKYSMLALDLDGTLLRSDGSISHENMAALRAARENHVKIVVCTGRGWAECRHILKQIDQVDPVIVAGGSIIAEAKSGATIHREAMELSLVHEAVGAVNDAGHAALVLKDPHEVGYEYLVVHGRERRQLDPVTSWWFRTMGVRVKTVDHVHEDEHEDHTVRVGACAPSNKLADLAERLQAAAHGRGIVHHFPAVVAPDHATKGDGDGKMHILELFDARANKWSGACHLAAKWNIPHERIVAIGDEVNDESMIRGAGLGIAMGNAVPKIRDIAKRVTATNNEDGVAKALRQVLNGSW